MPETAEPAVEKGRNDKDLRQTALIDAATAVFAEHGYDAATTRQIAERAGCAEGLIHRYFGGKRGLLMAIVRRKSERARQLITEAVPEADNLHDEIRNIMLWSLEFFWLQREFMRVVSGRGIVDPEIGHLVGAGLHGERVRIVTERLARHKAAGRIRPDADLNVVAQMIAGLSYASGFYLQVVFDMPREDVHDIVKGSAHIIIRGIAANPEDCTDCT